MPAGARSSVIGSTATRWSARPSSTWPSTSRPGSPPPSSALPRCGTLRIPSRGASSGGSSFRLPSCAAPGSPSSPPRSALEVLGGNGYMEDWPMARQLRDAQCHTIWEGTENICCIDVRRAIRGENAHIALLERIERALDSATGRAGPRPTARYRRSCAQRHSDRSRPSREIGRRHGASSSRRLAELLADLTEGALLVEHAAWSLDRDGDARKALVARRFCSRRLGSAPLRGILDEDRSVIDLFEPLVRYGRIEASDLVA